MSLGNGASCKEAGVPTVGVTFQELSSKLLRLISVSVSSQFVVKHPKFPMPSRAFDHLAPAPFGPTTILSGWLSIEESVSLDVK